MSQNPIPPVPPIPYATNRPGTVELDSEARTFAMLCHLSAISAAFTVIGGIVCPIIFWALKKDRFPFVDRQGREAINFNISFLVYSVIAGILCFVFIGFILWPIVALGWLILLIIASIRTYSGEDYRYPFIFRVV